MNLWMHNGFVRVNEEKMSKSLGNFFTVREVLARYRPETVRFFILNSHYRSPLNYCDEQLDEANAALTRLYTALRGLDTETRGAGGDAWRERFDAAMNDDFNTPEAIALLFELARELNRARSANPREAAQLAAILKGLGGILGLLQADPEEFLKGSGSISGEGLNAEAVEDLIRQRLEARKAKQWSEADRIRNELKEQGIVLEDGPGGTAWRRE